MNNEINPIGGVSNQKFSQKGVSLKQLSQNKLLFEYFKKAGFKEDSYIYESDIAELKNKFDENHNGKLSIKEAKAMGFDGKRKEIKNAIKYLDKITQTDLSGQELYPAIVDDNTTNYFDKSGSLVNSKVVNGDETSVSKFITKNGQAQLSEQYIYNDKKKSHIVTEYDENNPELVTAETSNINGHTAKTTYKYTPDGKLSYSSEEAGGQRREYFLDDKVRITRMIETKGQFTSVTQNLYDDENNLFTQIVTADPELAKDGIKARKTVHQMADGKPVEEPFQITDTFLSGKERTIEYNGDEVISSENGVVKTDKYKPGSQEKLMSSITDSDGTHIVEYDGEGNTYVHVKNGESYSKTAARVLGKDASEEEKTAFRELNKELIHKFGKVEAFMAGEKIRVPGELTYNEANKEILKVDSQKELDDFKNKSYEKFKTANQDKITAGEINFREADTENAKPMSAWEVARTLLKKEKEADAAVKITNGKIAEKMNAVRFVNDDKEYFAAKDAIKTPANATPPPPPEAEEEQEQDPVVTENVNAAATDSTHIAATDSTNVAPADTTNISRNDSLNIKPAAAAPIDSTNVTSVVDVQKTDPSKPRVYTLESDKTALEERTKLPESDDKRITDLVVDGNKITYHQLEYICTAGYDSKGLKTKEITKYGYGDEELSLEQIYKKGVLMEQNEYEGPDHSQNSKTVRGKDNKMITTSYINGDPNKIEKTTVWNNFDDENDKSAVSTLYENGDIKKPFYTEEYNVDGYLKSKTLMDGTPAIQSFDEKKASLTNANIEFTDENNSIVYTNKDGIKFNYGYRENGELVKIKEYEYDHLVKLTYYRDGDLTKKGHIEENIRLTPEQAALSKEVQQEIENLSDEEHIFYSGEYDFANPQHKALFAKLIKSKDPNFIASFTEAVRLDKESYEVLKTLIMSPEYDGKTYESSNDDFKDFRAGVLANMASINSGEIREDILALGLPKVFDMITYSENLSREDINKILDIMQTEEFTQKAENTDYPVKSSIYQNLINSITKEDGYRYEMAHRNNEEYIVDEKLLERVLDDSNNNSTVVGVAAKHRLISPEMQLKVFERIGKIALESDKTHQYCNLAENVKGTDEQRQQLYEKLISLNNVYVNRVVKNKPYYVESKNAVIVSKGETINSIIKDYIRKKYSLGYSKDIEHKLNYLASKYQKEFMDNMTSPTNKNISQKIIPGDYIMFNDNIQFPEKFEDCISNWEAVKLWWNK